MVIEDDRRFHLELILFSPIFLSAMIIYKGNPYPHFILLPYMVLIVVYGLPRDVLALCVLLSAFIGLYRADKGLIIFYAVLIVSVLLMLRHLRTIRRKNELVEEKLSSIQSGAAKEGSAGSLSLTDDSLMSHYLSTHVEMDEDLGNVLKAVKGALYADGAFFFETGPTDGLRLRCSTESEGTVILTGGGVLHTVIERKQGLITHRIKDHKTDIGYIKKDHFDSSVIVPVIEGNFTIGALAVDSDRFSAFKHSDLNMLREFSKVTTGIIRRGRIFLERELQYGKLNNLMNVVDELIASLNVKQLYEQVVKDVYTITSGKKVALFWKRERGMYEVVSAHGLVLPEKRESRLQNTLVGNILRDIAEARRKHVTQESAFLRDIESVSAVIVDGNQKKRDPHNEIRYLRDVSTFRGDIFPRDFDVRDVHSLLCLPMFDQDDLVGAVIALSDRQDAFNAHMIDLLNFFTHMAAVSIMNAQLHGKIENMAKTDGLTGLFNHRSFQERLSDEFKRVGRSAAHLSLILTDIDHFKRVNDAHGHPAGDAVLRGVSDVIRTRVRETDFAARYGGEEFALILTNTDSRGAKIFAEELRKDVRRTTFPTDGEMLSVTVSLGIASFPEHVGSKEELIDRADRALYAAKENGRNRSILWSEVLE